MNANELKDFISNQIKADTIRVIDCDEEIKQMGMSKSDGFNNAFRVELLWKNFGLQKLISKSMLGLDEELNQLIIFSIRREMTAIEEDYERQES